MSQKAKKPSKKIRDLYTVELSPEIRPRLKRIALANNLTLAVVVRMCIKGGLPIVEDKLTELAA